MFYRIEIFRTVRALAVLALLNSSNISAEEIRHEFMPTSECAAIIQKIASGLDKAALNPKSDELSDVLTEATMGMHSGSIFWARELAVLESLVLSAIEKLKIDLNDENDILVGMRGQIHEFRFNNFEKFVEKLKDPDLLTRLLAMNSMFLSATNPKLVERALDQIELALSARHPEIKRFAFKGLWTLYRLYNLAANQFAEAENWANARDRVESMLAKGLEARLEVLEYDLDNNRIESVVGNDIILRILGLPEERLSHLQAEAFYDAVLDYTKIAETPQDLVKSNFESEFQVASIAGTMLFLDFVVRPSEIPYFSPEVISVLNSSDVTASSDARIYATFLNHLMQSDIDKYPNLRELFVKKYRLRKKLEKSRERMELQAQKSRLEALRPARRQNLLTLLSKEMTPAIEEEIIRKTRDYLKDYRISYASLRFRASKDPADLTEISLDQVATRLGLRGFAQRLQREFSN